MENKFSKTGVYVVLIKDLSEDERIYKDNKYSYNLYFYNTKKAFEKARKENVFEEEFLQFECFDVFPSNRENIRFYDANSEKYLDYDKFLAKKPYDENKFYCIVLEDIDVNSTIFSNEKYKQNIYEFNTKEELNDFINGKETNNKLIHQRTGTLINYNKDNISYLLRKGDKQKVFYYDSVLNEKDFSIGKDFDSLDANFITKVVFFPSGDTYVFNCHEDAINEAIMNLSHFIEEEIGIERFIEEVESAYNGKRNLKYKYVGKTVDFDVDCVESNYESIIFVSNYLKFDFIYTNEEIEYLKKKLSLEKETIRDLGNIAKNNPEKAVEKAKELLILMQIIDNDGNVLEPYNVIFKDGCKVSTKIQGTPKTKTSKKTNK